MLRFREYVTLREKAEGMPTDVEEGGLRKRLGLETDKPLEDQTTPEKVAEYFKNASEDGRGKVMYAVNSNKKDSKFWKDVYDLIKDEEKED